VSLGAFGKHPGWDDHLDDPGLASPLLVELKRVLYAEGIASQVDSGAWDKLPDTDRLEGFGHRLLARSRGDVFAARIWSSRDGKGRSKYPMVAAASVGSVDFSAAEPIFLALDAARDRCIAATDAPAVRAALDAARADLHSRISAAPRSEPGPDPAALAALARHPDLAGEKLPRVLYHLEREAPAFVRGLADGGSKTKWVKIRPAHLRLPLADDAGDRPRALTRWASALLVWLDPNTPLTLIAPDDRPWIDVLVGPPEPGQMFCLRAGPAALPLVTDVPYTLDASLIARARPGAMLALALVSMTLAVARAAAQDQPPAPPPAPPAAPQAEPPAAPEAVELEQPAGEPSLFDQITDPRTPPARVVELWRSLVDRPGELWPTSPDHLAAEIALRAPVDKAAREISPELAAQVARERRNRLASYLAAARSVPELDAGLDAVEPLGFSIADLDPRQAYNLRLRRFKAALFGPAVPGDDRAVRERARLFAKTTRETRGGVAFLAPAADLLKGLDELAAVDAAPSDVRPPARPGPAPLSAFGPAATGLFSVTLDGPRARFISRAPDNDLTLEFVRVEPSNPNDRPFYLGVREVSLADVVALARRRATPIDLASVLPRRSLLEDPRQGPRVWTWPLRMGPQAWPAPSPAWIPRTAPLAAPTYAEGSEPPPPSAVEPMQWLSPQAAAYIAALAGCRLPTAGEWARAARAFPAAVDAQHANLRDRTWLAHARHVESLRTERFPPPAADAGSFAPTGDLAALETDDAVLWFAPVDAGPTTPVEAVHLVGNVAEYVLRDLDEPPPPFPADPIGAGAALRRAGPEIGVVGGSALSDPARSPDQVIWIPIDTVGEGYADVGMRLAFTAPLAGDGSQNQPVLERLRALLEPTPYIWPR
jgi:hypothetical protein